MNLRIKGADMAAKKTAEKNKTLEEVFYELDQVMESLQAEDISLEDSFSFYHQGMELLKLCNDKIDTVEKKMMVLDEEGEEHEF